MINKDTKTTSISHDNDPNRSGNSWKTSTPPPRREPSKPQPK